MNHNNLEYISAINNLGIKNQSLISKYLDYGLIAEAKQLCSVDRELKQLLCHKAAQFDFITSIASGNSLLVGEGNLSFSLSLLSFDSILPRRITATTKQPSSKLSEDVAGNARKLRARGVSVLHGVDATKLDSYFVDRTFDSIIFQFPHTGSREPIFGKNPNHILIRKFLVSAKKHLNRNGKVIISAVDNPHYRGAFQFYEAAEYVGFSLPEVYKFAPSQFTDYTHAMTLEDDSAIEDHKDFATWVFQL